MGSQIYTSRFDLSTIPRVKILDKPLVYETAVKSLGVWLTPTLNWKTHVSQVSRRVHCALHSLKNYKHALSRQLKKELVESLVFPHFDYGCAIYYNVDVTRALKLQRAQNACVRFVYGNIGRREHVTPHRLELGWLSAAYRRDYFLGTLAFRVIAFRYPEFLAKAFTLINVDINIRTSSRLPPKSLYYPPRRTDTLNCSFVYVASKLLNTIPNLMYNPNNVEQFKSRLFDILKQRDRLDWRKRQELGL